MVLHVCLLAPMEFLLFPNPVDAVGDTEGKTVEQVTEIITFSFTSPDSADTLGAEEESPLRSFVKLLNPLTVDQSVMRTSLVPGLLATVKTNILHDEKDLKLFEWGKVFIRKEGSDLPFETNYLAALMTGLYCQRTWNSDERHVDFYDIKGALETF